MADVANWNWTNRGDFDVMVCEWSQFERDIIGGILRQNTLGYRPRCFDFRNQSLGLCWQPNPKHHGQMLKLILVIDGPDTFLANYILKIRS